MSEHARRGTFTSPASRATNRDTVGDWLSEHEHRYLVHYSDGGSGMREYDRLLNVGDELMDGGRCRTVSSVSSVSRRRRRAAGSTMRGWRSGSSAARRP
jgi:hypothetical protein